MPWSILIRAGVSRAFNAVLWHKHNGAPVRHSLVHSLCMNVQGITHTMVAHTHTHTHTGKACVLGLTI